LRCKYRSARGWNADAIARGIESFQVLYGVDVDGNGVVDRYINASDIEALDDAMTLNGENAIARLADRQSRTHWKKVRAVKVSILVRSAHAARDADAQMTHHLFDAAYQNADDIGVSIAERDMAVTERKRIRKVFTQTIQLRNDGAASAI
jgi:type IV pilus assembly protein PilW